MRTLVVVAAGAADRPIEELGGRTPLEAAATPHLDRLARDGRVGRLRMPHDRVYRPSDFTLSLFGLDPRSFGDIGAVLDAASVDVDVGSLDQAFRLDLVTADGDTILDPTGGGMGRDEAALLLASLSDAIADDTLTFTAGPSTSHVLVWRGARDIRVKTVPPFDVVERSLDAALPRGTGIGRLLSAIERSASVLGEHEVNALRRELGENPATMIWPWAPGVSTALPPFADRTGTDACVIAAHAGMLGAAKLQGIACVSPVDGDDAPTNVREAADRALAELETHELVWLHDGSLARASLTRDFVDKVESLERVDGYMLGPILRAIDDGLRLRVVVIGGPAIASATGRILDDAVPFVLFGSDVRSHRQSAFTEVAAKDAGFGVDRAHELLDFVLHLPA